MSNTRSSSSPLDEKRSCSILFLARYTRTKVRQICRIHIYTKPVMIKNVCAMYVDVVETIKISRFALSSFLYIRAKSANAIF